MAVYQRLNPCDQRARPGPARRAFFGSSAISCREAAAGSDAAGSAGGAGTAAARAEFRGSWQRPFITEKWRFVLN